MKEAAVAIVLSPPAFEWLDIRIRYLEENPDSIGGPLDYRRVDEIRQALDNASVVEREKP